MSEQGGRPTKYTDDKSGIYALCCPETGQVRYVGQSNNINKRYSKHLTNYRAGKGKARYGNWLKSLCYPPKLKVLQNTHNLDVAEVEWIDYYRKQGYDLVNIRDGGEGFPDSFVYALIRNLKNQFRDANQIYSLCEQVKKKYLSGNDQTRQVMEQRAKSLLSK